MVEILLASIPLLFLVVSLLAGFYPGFETIVRISERIASHDARRRAAKIQATPRRPDFRAASGGLLIAFGHAQRPPPLFA